MSGSASLALCVLRKRRLGTVCPKEARQCLHAMLLGRPSWPAPSTADSALPVSQALGHTDTVPVSWFLQHTAEHVWHEQNTCPLLHPIQEYVKIVLFLQRLLLCVRESCFTADSSPLPYYPFTCCDTSEYVTEKCNLKQLWIRTATSVGHNQSGALM